MQTLLARHGLEVFDVESNDVNGGSIRTFICQKGRYPTRSSVDIMEKREDRLALNEHTTYERFAENITKIRTAIRDFVAGGGKRGEKVCVFCGFHKGKTIHSYF